MFNFKVVLFFLVFSTISCDEIVDFVLKTLVDHSVDPCDNFYRHVCAANTEFGVFDSLEKIATEELNKTFTPTDDASIYLHELIQCRETPYINGTITKKFIEQYQFACENRDGEGFLRKVEYLYEKKPYVTCSDASGFFSFLEEYEELFVEQYQERCNTIIPYVNKRLWIHQNMAVLENFKNIFQGVKNIFYNWVESTPSIRNNNVTEIYQEIVKSSYFNDESASEYIQDLTREYKKCRTLLGTWLKDSELSNIICIVKNWKNMKEIDGVYDVVNAKNSDEKIFIGLPFFMLASKVESRPFFLGQYGFIIAHELGHSIIQSLFDNFGLFFSNRTTDCIQSQFRKTCSTFNEEEDDCEDKETRIDDNGADLLGGRGSIYIAKQELGDKFYQPSEKYEDLTNAKLFFYGLATSLCNALGSDDNHSQVVNRYNAVAVQSPEFQEAFQCKPTSKMMQSLHRKCYILGENASTQKHSGI